MLHTPEQVAADAASLHDHKCPECGADLKPMNAVALRSHRDLEFPHGDEPALADSDYVRRFKALSAYIAERFKGGV